MKYTNPGATRTAFIAALGAVALLSACAVYEPLQDPHLQREEHDPRLSVVVLHFKTAGPTQRRFLRYAGMDRHWVFAVANQATGWNFRRLDETSMILRAPGDSLERDDRDSDAGWVTFLAPPGLSYIAVTTHAAANQGIGVKLAARPLPDRVSVTPSATPQEDGWTMIDFIDAARFAVQVPEQKSLVYAGTLVRTFTCGDRDELTCPYDLTLADQSGLAQDFVTRYRSLFPPALPLQTMLLTIPPSRTIEIRGGPEGDRLR